MYKELHNRLASGKVSHYVLTIRRYSEHIDDNKGVIDAVNRRTYNTMTKRKKGPILKDKQFNGEKKRGVDRRTNNTIQLSKEKGCRSKDIQYNGQKKKGPILKDKQFNGEKKRGVDRRTNNTIQLSKEKGCRSKDRQYNDQKKKSCRSKDRSNTIVQKKGL